MIGNINGIIDKVASRKLGVTGMVEITWPIAAIAMAYIAEQAAMDTWGLVRQGRGVRNRISPLIPSASTSPPPAPRLCLFCPPRLTPR